MLIFSYFHDFMEMVYKGIVEVTPCCVKLRLPFPITILLRQ